MIFYFTGSGNSYAVAKQIAERIEGEQVIPLARFNDFQLCDTAERIGIVFPCYCASAPDIVLDFKKKLFKRINKTGKYVFAVITYAHSPAGSYLDFKEDVDAWFRVKMPENDIYGAYAPSPQKEKTLLAQSVVEIDRFAKDILNKKAVIMYRDIPGLRFVSKQANKALMYKNFDKKLYADDKCVKCKQCIKYCPVQNITFDNKPVWGENCASCFGCVSRCPQNAIQAGKRTQGKRRYVHPGRCCCRTAAGCQTPAPR
jgi:Pyruvate/2-oxoacid:ferredoxin oxidoreductase delta subunit/flavodoxin